ncbi:AAA family ATPase [Candidatus Nitrosocosmicus hydrocola]|uniref:AAA family ATPase n=1 Tax=Candidatus Nitrosocosmicus hydrocola TaxID=1826872 RepID=UPI0011E60731|nr:AAA family ATPase [Candidatus Nitrosocosmicus hydrocola]
MKIDNIKISNILSFREVDDVTKIPIIPLKSSMNILIGPNGSGKSNFLEILTRIFRNYLILGCVYDPQNIIYNKNNPSAYNLNNTIRREQRLYPLAKYRHSKSDSMVIELEILLSQGDLDNLLFIIHNRTELLNFFAKYTDASTSFEEVYERDLLKIQKLEISFHLEHNNNTPNIILKNNDPVNRFIHRYFQYFDYLQNLISLSNNHESKNWNPLNNTFLLISSHRDYHSIETSFPINNVEGYRSQDISNRISQDSAIIPHSQEPNNFLMAKYILAHKFNHLRESILKRRVEFPVGKTDTELFEESEDAIKNINKLLNKLVNLNLKIDKQDEINSTFDFLFYRNNNPISIQELSSGEKGIIYLVIGIYGLDIKDGLIIIDEPEIHIHPQMQQKLVEIINQAQYDLNLQVILATHSPVFVTPKTIQNIHRFFKSDNYTNIISNNITHAESELVNILTYTNSAKLFFSTRVIMVEGDSDEYFYKFLFENWKKLKILDDTDIDFVYIRGKGNYFSWNKFLSRFNIQSFYLGDLDNILNENFGIVEKDERKKLRSDFDKSQFSKTDKSDSNFLQFIRKERQEEWKHIVSKLESLGKQGLFFLQHGVLENYIYNITKDDKLENVIEFCNSHFEKWMIDTNYSTHRTELCKILKAIAK